VWASARTGFFGLKSLVIFTGPRHQCAEGFFLGERKMWKIVVGFLVIAGLAIFLLNKGGDIDMGGEKHGALSVVSPLVSVAAVTAVTHA
jgi:hypothetical protein